MTQDNIKTNGITRECVINLMEKSGAGFGDNMPLNGYDGFIDVFERFANLLLGEINESRISDKSLDRREA